MSLEGAQFICLDEDGNRGEIIVAKGRKFTVGYYVSCDFVLSDDRAMGIHCTIECDAFGRITIRNMSPEHPVLVNGSTVDNKRNLFNKSTISILDKRYLWEFSSHSAVDKEDGSSENISTPKKQIGIPEQTGFSSPGVKTKKSRSRFTVHTFAYCIQSDEDGNVSVDSNKNNESSDNVAEEKEEKSQEILQESSEAPPQAGRQVTPEPESGNTSISSVQGTPKMNLLNCTNNKENTGSTQKKNRIQLSMCHQSEVVITSFSPRETGVRTEKSFTAIVMPKVLVTRAPNTPKSVYSTPKSLLGDDDDDNEIDRSRYINFHTPSTSKKACGGATTAAKSLKNSSMYLIDYTTPKKLAPASPYLKSALKASAKKLPLTSTTEKVSKNKTASGDQLGVSALPFTPVVSDDNKSKLETPNSVQSIISLDSTDTSSVIEILSDESTPGLSSVKTPQKAESTKAQSTTPMRTPQSLMKRAILTSRSKQVTTPQRGPENVQTTPRRETINRIPLRSSIGALRSPVSTPKPTCSEANTNRRQSISTPPRKSVAASAPKFESTPNSKTKFANPSPSRRCLIAKSASKATSTPLATGSYGRYSGCNTTPLNKVRKSFGGVPLSSHISKARKSIIEAAPSNFTSIKDKSPQQKMSDKILYRARKSLSVTPMIARAIHMVHTAKDTPNSILKQSKTPRKSMAESSRSVLFADKQPKEQIIDHSLTFILDSDDEESYANKRRKKVEGQVSKRTDDELPQEYRKTNINEVSKHTEIINLTFSPRKDEEIQQEAETVTTEETPVDVDEVPLRFEESSDKVLPESINQQGNISTIEICEDTDDSPLKEEEHEVHVPLTSQATEESFAEEILETQKEELLQINATSKSVRTTEDIVVGTEKIETGFGEEPEASTTKEFPKTQDAAACEKLSEIPKIDNKNTYKVDIGNENLSEITAPQSRDVLDKSSDMYNQIYEDKTLETSVIEKEVKGLSLLEPSKNVATEVNISEEPESLKENVIEAESTENNSGPTSNASTEKDLHKVQEKDKDVLVGYTDEENLDSRTEVDKPKDTTRETADVFEEKEPHLTTEESTEVAAEKATTCKLLEEIEDVLNKSDEFNLKHSTELDDGESIPTLTDESEKLTQDSNSRSEETKDIDNAEEPDQKGNFDSEENKNTQGALEMNDSNAEELLSISSVNEEQNQESNLECKENKGKRFKTDSETEGEIRPSISETTTNKMLGQENTCKSEETKNIVSDAENESEIKEAKSPSLTDEELGQESNIGTRNNKETQAASEQDDTQAVSETKDASDIESPISMSSANEVSGQERNLKSEELKKTQAASEKDNSDTSNECKMKKSILTSYVNVEQSQESNLEIEESEDKQAASQKDATQFISDTSDETEIKQPVSASIANEILSQNSSLVFEEHEDKQAASDNINDSELEELISTIPANKVLSQEGNLDSEESKDTQAAPGNDATQIVTDTNTGTEINEPISASYANEGLSQESNVESEESKDKESAPRKDPIELVSSVTKKESEIEESISTSQADEVQCQESNLQFVEDDDKQAASYGKNDSEIEQSIPITLESEDSKATQADLKKHAFEFVPDINESEIKESITTSQANEDLSRESEEKQGALETKTQNEIEESTSSTTSDSENDVVQAVSGTENVGDLEESISTCPAYEEFRQQSSLEPEEHKDIRAASEKNDTENVSYNKNEREIEESVSKTSKNEDLSNDSNLESAENKDNKAASEKDVIQVSADSKHEIEIKESITTSSANEEPSEESNSKCEETKATQVATSQDEELKSLFPIKPESGTDSESQKGYHLSESNDGSAVGHILVEDVKTVSTPRRRIGRLSVAVGSGSDTKSTMEISVSTDTTHTVVVENVSVETLTPRRTSLRKSVSASAQLEASSLKTPAKAIIETEAESAHTPRRSSRKKSIYAETCASEKSLTTLTPRHNTRRASMTVEMPETCTPTTTNTKSRRASLSSVTETPLTPKRITRRRSSISVDADEVVKVVHENKASSDEESTGLIFEEMKEDMGAIIEEEEEAADSEETAVEKTPKLSTILDSTNNEAIVESTVLVKETDDVKVVIEDVSKAIVHHCAIQKGEQSTENVQTIEQTVQDLTPNIEGGDNVASKSSQDLIIEKTNIPGVINDPEQDIAQDNASIFRAVSDNENVCDTTQDEEDMAVVVDVSVQDLTEDKKLVHSENDEQDVTSLQDKTQGSVHDLTTHNEGTVGEVVNVSIQDLTRDDETVCNAAGGNKLGEDLTEEEIICGVGIESEIHFTKDEEGEPTQPEDVEGSATAEEDMETLEVSDDDSIYDYGKEVKAPVTPKAKKYKRTMAGTPKTPVMTGVRNLLKTPKPEQNTPKLGAIRHLMRIPKLKSQETEEEETEKLQGMQEIVKTPTAQSKEVGKATSSQDTEKDLRGVKELLKTPKSCATPRFKGMRELLQTPKGSCTPGLGGVKELLDTPKQDHGSKFTNVEVPNDNHEKDEKCSDDKESGDKEHSSAAPNATPDTSEPLNTKHIEEIETESPMTSQKGKTELRQTKDLMSTPKSCATPRFKGVRELMKTPKMCATPQLCGVKELLDTPKQGDVTEIRKDNPKSLLKTDVGDKHEELMETFTQKSDDEKEFVTNQSICEEDSKVVKELLNTPKGCSTPRFKGIRELMKTPKMCSTPALVGIKELMSTPKQDKGDLDKFLKTPRAKNIMIPSLPSSAVIEKREDSVEMMHSIEYNLNDSQDGASANLGELFKTPVATRFVDRLSVSYGDEDIGQDYEEVNTSVKEKNLSPDLHTNSKDISVSLQTPSRKDCRRKSLLLKTPLAESPFSAADVLTDSSRTEIDDWVDKIDPLEQTINLNNDDDVLDEDKDGINKPREDSRVIILDDSTANDSLSVVPETCVKVPPVNVSTSSEAMINISTTNNTASKDPLRRSTTGKSKQKDKPPITPSETADISGIDLLDETTESVLDISLVVSDDNEEEHSAESNKSLIVTSKQDDTLCEEADNALSEPLLLSDNDETEEAFNIESKNEDAYSKSTSSVNQQQEDLSTNILEQGLIEVDASKAQSVKEVKLSNKNIKNRESEDIFLNDTVAEEDATIESDKEIAVGSSNICEGTPDKSQLIEGPVEKETEKDSSPKECQDIFMEDSVNDISVSIKDTNDDEAPSYGRTVNEDIIFESLETVETPNNTKNSNEEEISAEEDTDVVVSEVQNETVSLSQEENNHQTNSTNVICLDDTNNDDDVTQKEIKTLVADEVITEIIHAKETPCDLSESVEHKNDGASEEVISISESTTSEEIVQSDKADENEEQSSEFNKNDNSERSRDVISIDDSSCEEVPEITNKDGGVETETLDKNETKADTIPEKSSDVDVLINTETNLEQRSNKVTEEASEAVSLSSSEKIEENMGEKKNLSESSEASTEVENKRADETTLISDDESSSSHDIPNIGSTIQQIESKTLALAGSSELGLTIEGVKLNSDAISLPIQCEPDDNNVVANATEVSAISEQTNKIVECENTEEVFDDVLKEEQYTVKPEKCNLVEESGKIQDILEPTNSKKDLETSVTSTSAVLEDIRSSVENTDVDNAVESSGQIQISKDICEMAKDVVQASEAIKEATAESEIDDAGRNQTEVLSSESIAKPDIKSTPETKEEAKVETTENISFEANATEETSTYSENNKSNADNIEEPENQEELQIVEDIPPVEGEFAKSEEHSPANENKELEDPSEILITETVEVCGTEEQTEVCPERAIESDASSELANKTASKITEKQADVANTALETTRIHSDKMVTKSDAEEEHTEHQEFGVVDTVVKQSQPEGIQTESDVKKYDKLQMITESAIVGTVKSYDIEVKIRDTSKKSTCTNLTQSESDEPTRQDKTTKRTKARKGSQSSACSNDSNSEEAPKTRRKRKNTKTEEVTPHTLHTVKDVEGEQASVIGTILESEETDPYSDADTSRQESKTPNEKLNKGQNKQENRAEPEAGMADVHKSSENKSDTQTEKNTQDTVHDINLKRTKSESAGKRKVKFAENKDYADDLEKIEETPIMSSIVQNTETNPSETSEDQEVSKTTEEIGVINTQPDHLNLKDTDMPRTKTEEPAKLTRHNTKRLESSSTENSDICNEKVAAVLKEECVVIRSAEDTVKEADNTTLGSLSVKVGEPAKRNRRKPSKTERKLDETGYIEQTIEESEVNAEKKTEIGEKAETLPYTDLQENIKSRQRKGSQDAPDVKISRRRLHSTTEKESNEISKEQVEEPKLSVTVHNSENTENTECVPIVPVDEESKPAKRTRRKASIDSTHEDENATHSRKVGRRKGTEDKELGVIKELEENKSIANVELEQSEKLTGTTEEFSKLASNFTKDPHDAGHTRRRRRASQDSDNDVGSMHSRKGSGRKAHLDDKGMAVLETITESSEVSLVPRKEHEEEQKTTEILEEEYKSGAHSDQQVFETVDEEKPIENIPEKTSLTTIEEATHDSNKSPDPVQKSSHHKHCKDATTGDDKAPVKRQISRKKVRNEIGEEEDTATAPTEELMINTNKSKGTSDLKESTTKEAENVLSQVLDKQPSQPTTTRRTRRLASQSADQETCTTTKSRGRHHKVVKTTADEEEGTLPEVEEDTGANLTAESHELLDNLNEKKQVADEAVVSVEGTRDTKIVESDNKDQILEAGASNATKEQGTEHEHAEIKKHNPVARRARRKPSQETTHKEDGNNQHSRGTRTVKEPEIPVVEQVDLPSSRSRSKNRKVIEEKRSTPKSEQEEVKVETNVEKSESDNPKHSDEDSKVAKNSSLLKMHEQNPPKKSIKRPFVTSDTTCESAAGEEPVTRRSRHESHAIEEDTNDKLVAVSSNAKLNETSEPGDEHPVSETSADVKHSDKPRKPITRRKAAAAHSNEEDQQEEKITSRSRRGQKAPDIDPGHQADQSDDQYGHDEKPSLKSRRGRKVYGKDDLINQSDHSEDQHGSDEKHSLRSRRCRKAHDDNFDNKQGHSEKPSSRSRKGHKANDGVDPGTQGDHSEDEMQSSKTITPENVDEQHGNDEKSSLKSQTDIKPQDDERTQQDGHTEDQRQHIIDEKLPTRTRRGRKAGGHEEIDHQGHGNHEHDEKASTSTRRGRKVKDGEETDHQVNHTEDQHEHDEKPSVKSASEIKALENDKSATPMNDHPEEQHGHGEKSSTRSTRGRKAHDAETGANQDGHKEEESKSTRRRAAVTHEESIPASRRRGVVRNKVDHEKEDSTPETKEITKRSNRRKKDEPIEEASTPHEEPSDHDISKSHTSTEPHTDHDENVSNTKQDELNTTSEDSPNKRGRNVPQRRAATHHSYDETSDSEKPEKRKKKTESPRKSMEAAKSTHLETIVSEPSAVPSPTLLSSAVTARGRTRKPTARVQQFLEEERAKAETPKKRAVLATAVDTPTKGKPLRRGTKTVTDAEVIGTPQSNKQTRGRAALVADENEDEQTTSPTTAKGRKGSRKAKADVRSNHSDATEEPPAKKSPAELEAEKDKDTSPKNEASTPTRVAGRRNAAAAAKFRIEEDALATAAIDPPKKSRARKQPAKAVTIPEKRDHRLVSASTVEEDDENPEQSKNPVKEEIKPAIKRGGTRRAASAATESTDSIEVGLPAKKSRKAKAATETHGSDTEPASETKSSRSAATTRGGRRNVHFQSADQNTESAATDEPATTNKRATRVRRI